MKYGTCGSTIRIGDVRPIFLTRISHHICLLLFVVNICALASLGCVRLHYRQSRNLIVAIKEHSEASEGRVFLTGA